MKQLLSREGVAYVVKNVDEDPEALAEFLRLGFLLPPVTVVDGIAVAGYDPERLIGLLSRHRSSADADDSPARQ